MKGQRTLLQEERSGVGWRPRTQWLLLACMLGFSRPADTDACVKCQCSDFCTGFDAVRILKSTSCLVNCRGQSLSAMPTAMPANVKELVLASNAFTALPIDAFDTLTNLQRLDLSANFLTEASLYSGTRGLFDYLERLEHLDLSTNTIGKLSDAAGAFVKRGTKATWASLASATATAAPGGGLRSLTYLDVSGNLQRAAMPAAALGGLAETLQTLKAYSMDLEGTLPASIAALTELRHLDLSFSRMSGNVPAMSALAQLTSLSLYSNRLQGALPDLSGMPNLVTAHLAQNEFTGAVPHAQLRTLASLKQLYLHGNRLTGTVPDYTELPYTQYDSCLMVQNRFTCDAALGGVLPRGGPSNTEPCGLAGSGAGGCT
eukprot:g1665.t1